MNIANVELAFQNGEKEKRADELAVANVELRFQNNEKEKRAAELNIANVELAFQNVEKEKRAAELVSANRALLTFAYVSSHDLQEPLRKIQILASRLLEKESKNLSDTGKGYFQSIQASAHRMQQLILDLLAFSRINTADLKFEITGLAKMVDEVMEELSERITEKRATVTTHNLGMASIIPFQFRQLMQNLISNALKFSHPNTDPVIIIKSKISSGLLLTKENPQLKYKGLSPEKDYCHITVSDNGIGFEPEFKDRIFELFQQLHGREKYGGTGIGLAIVKKIIENHNGTITATSEVGEGATFDIYIPQLNMI